MDKQFELNIIEKNKFLSEKQFSKHFPEVYKNIINNTLFLNDASFSERKYCYINEIFSKPKCVVCGKYLKFRDVYVGYGKTCSNKCSRNFVVENITIERQNEINQKHSNTIIEKIKERTDEEKEKISESFRLFHQNMSEDKKRLRAERISNSSKIERTNRTEEKWKETTSKRKETFNLKSIDELNEIYSKISRSVKETMNAKSLQEWIKITEKQFETKKQNNSFNTSKPEEEIYNKLILKFNNVIRQHKTEEYPFHSDFYIPELDLYIEYQGQWTHGGQPFDENNKLHLNKLNEWSEKSIKSKFYKNAIETWTIRDPLKRKTAKENNLNWIEFFTLDEFNKWFESLNI